MSAPAPGGRRRIAAALAVVLALALGAVACGDDSDRGRLGTLTVADAGFTESRILADMYGELLIAAGYDVERTSVQSTEIAQSSLESGEIDAMPQYVATYADLLNLQVNGDKSEPVSSSDLAASLAALRGLAAGLGLAVLEPAKAVDQNAFAVSLSFAAQHSLRTLSDLGALGLSVTLAAGAECTTRPFCEPGLERVYGIDVTEIVHTGVATAQTKAAVRDGEAQLGLVLTTDATVADYDLVVLADDRRLQNADNLVPIVNGDSLTPEIARALNALAPVLTTADLAELNKSVDAEQQHPEDVARDFLTGRGLLEN